MSVLASTKLYLLSTIVILCHLICVSSAELHRTVTVNQDPSCKQSKLNLLCDNFLHVVADGPSDTLHYLWDFTSKPSFLLAHTGLNASLKVNWTDFFSGKPGSVSILPAPQFSFGVTLNKLVEFDDAMDSGHFENGYRNESYDFNSFSWKMTQPVNNSLNSAIAEFESIQSDTSKLNGSVIFQIAAFGDQNHDLILPRLLHSANSSQIRMYLKNLSSGSGFNQSRWAVDLVVASSNWRNENETLQVDIKNNLDDENSPGVFKVVEVLTPAVATDSTERGFLQWRPVTYTAVNPSISNSSDVDVLQPTLLKDPIREVNGSLAYKFYGSCLSHILVQRTIVSFGSSQDGFYKKTNFTSWSFLMSYGAPQADRFSMLVLLVMGIGLGLPALLVISGGVFLCARRFMRHRDELSLE